MNFVGLVIFCLFAAISCSAKQYGKPRQENIRADFYNLGSVGKFERIPENVKMRLLYDDFGNGSSPSAYYSTRPGKATRTHRCGTVDHRIPSHLTFITRYPFYSKYTHAYGIPIIASSVVSDEALKRACYVTRFLFADRSDIRENMYKYFGRVAVIGKRQKLTAIPEFSHLPDWWNRRARGLGGTLHIPVSCGGEENLLCLRNDRYYGDDIFFHETAHAVAELAIRGGPNYDLDGLYSKLQRHYKNAKRRGLWRNTYAMDTVREYFAEGAQSFFNCHISVDPPNGIHNNINTREKLLKYDPGLYGLLEEVFPCKNTYHWCYRGAQPDMRMDCNERGPKPTRKPTQQPKTQEPASKQPPLPSTCKDNDGDCAYWSQQGHCEGGQYEDYMKTNCRKSCQLCTKGPKTEATTVPVTVSTQLPSTKATEIPESKQPPIPSTCEDNNGDCAYWSEQGHCKGGQYEDFMKKNCRKSCQLCTTGPKTEATSVPVTLLTQQPSTKATQIPESKQPPIPSTCEDNHRNCAYWSGLGHCKYGEHQAYMRINCKKSCDWCTSGPETGVDRNRNCAAWANDKTCKYNQWMKDNCCISCKLCTPLPTTGPKTVPKTVPTTMPTTVPTNVPTTQPTTHPTTHPTTAPTTRRTTIPTQRPTTKGDKDSNCPGWAEAGYCSENRWVRENCCKSCGSCTPVSTAGPTARPSEGPTAKGDKNANCAAWAEAGYCSDYNPPWMKANCCKSCGFC